MGWQTVVAPFGQGISGGGKAVLRVFATGEDVVFGIYRVFFLFYFG